MNIIQFIKLFFINFFINIILNTIIILLAFGIFDININQEPNEQYYKNNQCSYSITN